MLQLHESSRWANPEHRRLQAARAIEDGDEKGLQGLLREYIRAKSQKKTATSALTFKQYNQALRHLLDYLESVAQVHLLQTTEDHLEAMTGYWVSHHQFKRSTLDVYLAGVKAFFRALVWARVISSDPARDVRVPNIPSNLNKPFLSDEELDELRLSVKVGDPILDVRNTAILELGVVMMLRANEIVGLNLEDLYPARKVIRVHGKGGKIAELPLTERPLNALKAWLEVRGLVATESSHSALFLSDSDRSRGRRLGYGGVYQMLKKALVLIEAKRGESAGGMHTLRRTGATRFYRKTNDPLSLQRILRHESADTTARYVGLDNSSLRLSLEAMED
jgi:integrase/recombinase XerC